MLRGGFVVKAGKRKVTVQGLLLTIRGGKLTATAKVGTRRLTIFTGSSAGSLIDAATTSVTARSSKLSLTPAGAKQLNKSLRTRGFKRAVIGKLSGAGKAALLTSTPPPSGTPSSNFNWTEPPVLAKTDGWVPATASALTIWPRVSFINYLRAGGGNASAEGSASNGSVDQPRSIMLAFSLGRPASSRRRLQLHYAIRRWWLVARRQQHRGLLLQRHDPLHVPRPWNQHPIADAEVEFNGANSRVIYRIADADNPAGKRGDVVDAAGPRRDQSSSGRNG